MLVYLNSRFLQVLEGEKQEIENLYRKIQADRRHDRVYVLLSGPLGRRNFENWAMGFREVDRNDHDRFQNGLEVLKDIENATISPDDHPALQFLKMFYDKQMPEALKTERSTESS